MPPELVRFLKFVIKTDRKMGARYMIFEEMLREEKQEGRPEGFA